MKRAGFTMIELIFVIVILGILASVAVPKLLGVKNSAEEGLVKSFVGGLNTTVGPAKWSQSLMDGNDGTLSVTGDPYSITVNDTDFPKGVVSPLAGLNKCVDSTTQPVKMSTGLAGGFDVFCLDGTGSSAPKFFYADQGDVPTVAEWTAAITANKVKIK